MTGTLNIEQAVLENMRTLPPDKQQEVLDFVEFLKQKVKPALPVSEGHQNSSMLAPAEPATRLSLQEIAKLPVGERHKLLAPFIAATAEDFLNDPE